MANSLATQEFSKNNINHINMEPPAVLVDTWVWMMTKSPEPELQQAGRNRLVEAFGDLHSANQFHRSHLLSR